MLLEAVHLPNVDRDIIPEPLFGHLEPFAWLGNEVPSLSLCLSIILLTSLLA